MAAHPHPTFMSDMRAVLTAMAICTGSWRGTTEVMMMTHLSRSSCVVRSFFSNPLTSTLPADASANARSTSNAKPVSLESADTCQFARKLDGSNGEKEED